MASVEWYTPEWLVARAARVLGGVDLDPASHPAAPAWRIAGTSYREEDDGLARPWGGNVWLQPPYTRGGTHRWTERLVDHLREGRVTAACSLLRLGGSGWYSRFVWSPYTVAVCIFAERIPHIGGDGVQESTPRFDHQLVLSARLGRPLYRGVLLARFAELFGDKGAILTPHTWTRAA